MSYAQPHMVEALKGHVLQEITPPGSLIRGFRMGPPDGSRRMSTLLTFSPEGIIILGDLRSGDRGLISDHDVGLGWFCGDVPENDLCEKFGLRPEWQPEAAARDLRHLAQRIDPLEAIRLVGIREGIDAGAIEEDGLRQGLQHLGFDRKLVADIGYDFPLADAGWLVAIQRKFAELWRQVS